jgi:hypothetical protein
MTTLASWLESPKITAKLVAFGFLPHLQAKTFAYFNDRLYEHFNLRARRYTLMI